MEEFNKDNSAGSLGVGIPVTYDYVAPTFAAVGYLQ
jgi:hypothetical protein